MLQKEAMERLFKREDAGVSQPLGGAAPRQHLYSSSGHVIAA